MLLKRDTRRPVAHLFPDRAAGYEFRARYDDGSAVTKWSPLVGITVG